MVMSPLDKLVPQKEESAEDVVKRIVSECVSDEMRTYTQKEVSTDNLADIVSKAVNSSLEKFDIELKDENDETTDTSETETETETE